MAFDVSVLPGAEHILTCRLQMEPPTGMLATESPGNTYIGQEQCVTADPTQADQELQGDPQVVAPFLIVG